MGSRVEHWQQNVFSEVCVMGVCVCVHGYVCARRWASVLAGARTCCHVCFGLID